MSIIRTTSNTESVIITLDTKDKTVSASPSTNCNVVLSSPVANVVRIDVRQIEFPYSFYTFNSLTNTFSFYDSVLRIVTIPQGNYTLSTISTELQTLMNAISSGYTVTYSYITSNITIANATSFIVKGTGTANNYLGFANTDTASATSISGVNVANLSGPNYLLLKSNALTASKNYSLIGSNSTSFKNVLYKIQLVNGPGGMNILSDGIFTINYGNTVTISTIDLLVTDSSNNQINLNGLDFSLTLELFIGYKV